MRLAPASAYSDPSLNPAIGDNENECHFRLHPKLPDFLEREEIREMINRDPEKKSLSTDYYVCCLTMDLEPRYFGDFDADSFLVIENPKKFTERLMNSTKFREDDYTGYYGGIKYFDPVLTLPEEITVIMAKHFRYAYQKEFRFVMLPKHPVKKLDPVFLEMGSLNDISSYYEC